MAVELRRERLRREMTNEILSATRLLLDKGGPNAISARAIARQLGVTAPAIYRYFPSLDALMEALNESVVSELCAALESARGVRGDGEACGGMAAAFRGWALDHPASFRLVLGLNGRHPGGQGLMGRLPRLPGAAASSSTLRWAALCGLALLELGEGSREDFGPLYAAAAALGALPQLRNREVDGAAAGGGCCAVDIFTTDQKEPVMAHIALNSDEPGIRGLFRFRPETAQPLNELVEVLLRDDNSLTRGERELIASYVSSLNQCKYCCTTHSAYAALQLPEGMPLVQQVCTDISQATVAPKLGALLDIAAAVQKGGKSVTPELVDAARAEGATDVEIHDTVLIAAAFCMYNRYVDGLGTFAPDDPEIYNARAQRMINIGYVGLLAESQKTPVS
jgi:uncharacterized peroxidase-related enzyme